MFSEAAIRVMFKVPAEYHGWYWTERATWVFDYCDLTITVNLRTWKGRESYTAYDHNVGHYFAEADWPAEKSAA